MQARAVSAAVGPTAAPRTIPEGLSPAMLSTCLPISTRCCAYLFAHHAAATATMRSIDAGFMGFELSSTLPAGGIHPKGLSTASRLGTTTWQQVLRVLLCQPCSPYYETAHGTPIDQARCPLVPLELLARQLATGAAHICSHTMQPLR